MLMPKEPEAERPAGIAVVSGVLSLAGIASFLFASLLLGHAVPLSAGSVLLPGGLEQSGPIAFLIYAALTIALAWALWTRRGWARRATILLAALGIFFAVPAISSAVVDGRLSAIMREGLQIIIRVAVIFYLTQEPVREWFAARQP